MDGDVRSACSAKVASIFFSPPAPVLAPNPPNPVLGCCCCCWLLALAEPKVKGLDPKAIADVPAYARLESCSSVALLLLHQTLCSLCYRSLLFAARGRVGLNESRCIGPSLPSVRKIRATALLRTSESYNKLHHGPDTGISYQKHCDSADRSVRILCSICAGCLANHRESVEKQDTRQPSAHQAFRRVTHQCSVRALQQLLGMYDESRSFHTSLEPRRRYLVVSERGYDAFSDY